MNLDEIKKLRELAQKATQADWQVVDRTVYALEHHGWRKGVEQFRNRFSCTMSHDGSKISQEELLANAEFIRAMQPAAVSALLDLAESALTAQQGGPKTGDESGVSPVGKASEGGPNLSQPAPEQPAKCADGGDCGIGGYCDDCKAHEQQSVTVDTRGFGDLMGQLLDAQERDVELGISLNYEIARGKLVEHINAWQRSVTAKAVADALASQPQVAAQEAPEAPAHYSSSEASAWQSGWKSGRALLSQTSAADYTTSHSELARKILTFMGYATSTSLEPGADIYADRLAEKLHSWIGDLATSAAGQVKPDDAPQECWSADEESFNYTELGYLLDSHELKPGDRVWRGIAVRPEPSELIKAEWIFEQMGEQAYDIAGEHAEDYPDVSNEAEAELDAFLAAWVKKHAWPNFWTVKEVAEYVLTEDDFAFSTDAAQPSQEKE